MERPDTSKHAFMKQSGLSFVIVTQGEILKFHRKSSVKNQKLIKSILVRNDLDACLLDLAIGLGSEQHITFSIGQ